MASVHVSLESLRKGENTDPAAPSYWRSENHTSDSYLRVDKWLSPEVEAHTLGGSSAEVKLSIEQGRAILRYHEDAKMFAYLRDMNNAEQGDGVEALADPNFWDEHWEAALTEWPSFPSKSVWLRDLLALRDALDERIASVEHSAFVKLSVRSPKDAVLCLKRHGEHLTRSINQSVLAWDSPETLGEDVRFLKDAAWACLKVTSGDEALQLLLRSDRIYLDILQAELFSCKPGAPPFDLNVHVQAFREDIDPGWEFRGFVSKGVRTSLTSYNPWFFDIRLLKEKDLILAKINHVWDAVEPHISCTDYSVDFAVTPDLQQCFVVEINAFLPPLAGAGLFNYNKPSDREKILHGPFEFRVKETPTQPEDFVVHSVDPSTGESRATMIMQPAPPHVMAFLTDWRRAKAGLLPLARGSSSAGASLGLQAPNSAGLVSEQQQGPCSKERAGEGTGGCTVM